MKNDYTKCCTHYNTDEYKNGYVMFKPFKAKICQNCGEVHLVCNKFYAFLFQWFFSLFWNGAVWVDE